MAHRSAPRVLSSLLTALPSNGTCSSVGARSFSSGRPPRQPQNPFSVFAKPQHVPFMSRNSPGGFPAPMYVDLEQLPDDNLLETVTERMNGRRGKIRKKPLSPPAPPRPRPESQPPGPSPAFAMAESRRMDLCWLRRRTRLHTVNIEKATRALVSVAEDLRVTLPEFIEALHRVGVKPQDNRCLADVFGAFDADGDGRLDVYEMLRLLGQMSQGSDVDRRKAVFSLFDRKDQGVVTFEEAESVCTQLCRLAITPEYCGELKKGGMKLTRFDHVASLCSSEMFRLVDYYARCADAIPPTAGEPLAPDPSSDSRPLQCAAKLGPYNPAWDTALDVQTTREWRSQMAGKKMTLDNFLLASHHILDRFSLSAVLLRPVSDALRAATDLPEPELWSCSLYPEDYADDEVGDLEVKQEGKDDDDDDEEVGTEDEEEEVGTEDEEEEEDDHEWEDDDEESDEEDDVK